MTGVLCHFSIIEVLLSSKYFIYSNNVTNLCVIMNTHRWYFPFRKQSLYRKYEAENEEDTVSMKSYYVSAINKL